MSMLSDIFEENQYATILLDNEKVKKDSDGKYLINIAYRRVSTDKQAEEGFGLDVQKDDILNYCNRHDIKSCVLFTDDGYTGTTLDRPALQQIITLITDFNKGLSNLRINTMIVPKIDRLSRSLLNTLQFIHDYIVSAKDNKESVINTNKYDINFISIQESFCRVDRDNPQSKLLLTLFASLAEYDRDLIVEKLKKGRNKRIMDGKWHGGGNVPYGYRYNKKTGVLEVEPEEKKKVQEIFRLYTEEKLPPQKIADILGFKGERIVSQILQRRSLLGTVSVDGKEYKGLHEPLISEKVFLEAQEEMKKRSVVRGNSQYLLSGLIYCGECGARMRYQKWGKSGECKILCYSQQKSKKYLIKNPMCDNEKFWQSDIEDAVIKHIFTMNYLNSTENIKTSSYESMTESIKSSIEKEKNSLRRLYDTYADSDGDQEQDEILKEKIKERKEHINALTETLKNEEKKSLIVKKLDYTKKVLRNLESTWKLMTVKEQQTILREIIDKIYIFKDGNIRVNLKLSNYLKKATI